jgi:hypothetical protein
MEGRTERGREGRIKLKEGSEGSAVKMEVAEGNKR